MLVDVDHLFANPIFQQIDVVLIFTSYILRDAILHGAVIYA
jgi:hypothetical protein